ncbi:unnamed protein product [Rotaria socialis]|uniref:Uncharacterized protein n=1 Tax=Rotaria socialis TaxID=392032 RepID=A0A821NB62_9BILA|nr:unnamed protein product [Rotaria socialis]CAF3756110.1 unnamed protein product [Rotaria socialis]CAF4761069.1 unnamed protein product [Rotaria socialis]CAF4784964.1 unnamed protein product [Rotaria socialis]
MQDYRSSKRLKIASEQSHYSNFACLSGDLILDLFEYFNTKEILQSFSDLTPLITSCIFDQHQQVHLYIDCQSSFVVGNYLPNNIVSLRIEHIAIPIATFVNLKSLYILHGKEREEECFDMVKQICLLAQLINLTLSFTGSELTTTGHRMIKMSLCHPSLRRINLLKTATYYGCHRPNVSPVKLIFPSVKLVYVSSDFHGVYNDHLCYKVGNHIPIPIQPQYRVRYLNLDFNNWPIQYLADLLSSIPLLVTLIVKGCGQTGGWLYIGIWHKMLQDLKALKYVNIDIYIALPFSYYPKIIKAFNEIAEQNIFTCKRINLAVKRRNVKPCIGGLQFNASLNMN